MRQFWYDELPIPLSTVDDERITLINVKGAEGWEAYSIETTASHRIYHLRREDPPGVYYPPCLGQTIKAWREFRKMTQMQVVVKAGHPEWNGYLSRIENGLVKRPGHDKILGIAEALGIDEEVLHQGRLPEESE